MSTRVVTVPAPHHMTVDSGPEWVFRSLFGDGDVRLVGIPECEDAPAAVALLVATAVEPPCEAIAYLAPDHARQAAGALVGAAENAERGGPRSSDPGSAGRTAKHVPAEPGLPNQPQDHSERTPMIRTRRVLARAARRLTRRDRVSCTPRELNRLITSVTAREVAGRFRERADWHREAARVVDTSHPDVAGWHRDEALALDELARGEDRQ